MEYRKEDIARVFDEVEKADSIVLFGHVNPDGDCLGSVYGMKRALKEFFPQKKVYAVGSHPKYLEELLDPSDILDEETYKKSLGFIVDVSDGARIEDKNYVLCKKLVCVDHHIANGTYSYPVFRDADAPSATLALARCLLLRYGRIPACSADLFYLGLVTDTDRFRCDSEPGTLEIAKKLIEVGADYRKLYAVLYRQDSASLRFRSYVYDHLKTSGKVTYVKVPRDAYAPLGIEENDASNRVDLISLLDGRPIWAQFTEQEDGSIRVELRSDGHYNVQITALAFGGGGHLAASGCKLRSLEDSEKVVEALNELPEVK